MAAARGPPSAFERATVVEAIRRRFEAAALTRKDHSVFRLADKDFGGTLDSAEVMDLIRRVLRLRKDEAPDEHVELLFEDMDADGSGSVSYEEFRYMLDHPTPIRFIEEMDLRRKEKELLLKQAPPPMSPHELAAAQEAFELLDEDGWGLKVQDVGRCLQALGFDPSVGDVERIVGELPGHHRLDLDSFVRVVLENGQALSRSGDIGALHDAFLAFDAEESGRCTVEEVEQLLTSYGEPLSPDELDDFMSRLAVDGSGTVDYAVAVRGAVFAADPLSELRSGRARAGAVLSVA